MLNFIVASSSLLASEGPDFFLIGAAKCGTGSLFRYIKKHPHIFSGVKKELHFFDVERRYRKGGGIQEYKNLFPKKTHLSQKIFEASPTYIFHPEVPKRVHRHFPEAKLIIVLRNPVDRAYSHYKMRRKDGYEKRSLSFREIIEKERPFLENDLKNPAFRWKRYLVQGVYLPQIKRWRKYFRRDQILILFSKDLFNKPKETVNRVYHFLNVEPHELSFYRRYNKGDDLDQLDPQTRGFLGKIYQPYNEELDRYLLDEFNIQANFYKRKR